MKLTSIIFFMLFSLSLMAQSDNHYTVFNPTKMKKEYFVSSNSGVLGTRVGFKVGFLSNPGLYLGFRNGIGKVYNQDKGTTSQTYLYSITAGITKPLIINGDFKLVAQVGGGYGEWYRYRWARWTKSGYELEAGIMIHKKKLQLALLAICLMVLRHILRETSVLALD